MSCCDDAATPVRSSRPLHALSELPRVLKPSGPILLNVLRREKRERRLSVVIGFLQGRANSIHLAYYAAALDESRGDGGPFRVFSMSDGSNLHERSVLRILLWRR